MSYSLAEQAHIDRLTMRLQSDAVKGAYAHLMKWAEDRRGLYLFPISRGAFSAIHLGTKMNSRPYADCEFGFTGAASHMRWWFRRPCFDSGILGSDAVLTYFGGAKLLKSGEVCLDVKSVSDADRLCEVLNARLDQKA